MAGTLPNVVSPEGLLAIDGTPYRVDMTYAGKTYSRPAQLDGAVEIDGAQVQLSPL